MLKITTLSENTAGLGGFLTEWGLSILVETDGKSVLLDTGQSISVAHNAVLMGVDLSRVDVIVLSHGHFDHTGGMVSVLTAMQKRVPVIAHPDVWADKYSGRKGQEHHYISIPFLPQLLETKGADFKLDKAPVKITESIMTTGEVPMVTPFEQVEPYLLVKTDNGYVQDEVLDDQALIVKTGKGLVVVLGCAHRGIVNTLYHARQITGVDKVYAVLGGCHLMDASDERIKLTIAALQEMGVEKLGVSHCTGLRAATMMAQAFGDKFFFNNAGTVIDFS